MLRHGNRARPPIARTTAHSASAESTSRHAPALSRSASHAAVSAMAADAYRERLLLFLAAQDGRLATGL